MSDTTNEVQAAARLLSEVALNVIQSDPHSWSTRPCETCRVVSELFGKPFGCDRYRLSVMKKQTPVKP